MDKYLFLLYVASGICSMAEGSAAILEKNPLSGSVYAVEWQDKEESCCQANGCLCPYPQLLRSEMRGQIFAELPAKCSLCKKINSYGISTRFYSAHRPISD